MAVISISTTQSGEELVAGIPRLVSIETNIPATIFYTLDGKDPDFFSEIYTGPITIPSNLNPVILKILASNGVDSSPIIEEVYSSNLLENARLPHAATDSPSQSLIPSNYPYGTPPIQPMGNYLNPGDSGQTVDDPSLPQIPSGFDGEGNFDGYTNDPYNLEYYKIIYSTTNSEGQYGNGIGNLPAKVVVQKPSAPPEETQEYTALFDPRALVIFQDVSNENPNDPPQINRQFFSLQKITDLDGSYLYNEGPDTASPTASFVKSHFNPRDNTITYYYRDSVSNRWLISKTPYKPKPDTGILYNIFSPRSRQLGFVYPWRLWARRILF